MKTIALAYAIGAYLYFFTLVYYKFTSKFSIVRTLKTHEIILAAIVWPYLFAWQIVYIITYIGGRKE